MRTEDRQPEAGLADREAFTEVFRRFYTPLVRFAYRITGNAASANDVLQDVFLKLWEDRTDLTVHTSLKALLYTMVRNRALNMNRRKRRVAADLPVEAAREAAEAESPDEDTLATAELRQHLYRWIGELPPRRAEAFMLSRYHGLKHSEIASVMGISVRTVDTHILLALRELRARLDNLQHEGTLP